MKNDSWYPWFPGDFKRDTGHLTLAEQGAYRNLLDHYYCNGPLPADDTALRRIAGMMGPQWDRSRAALLAFFILDDGVMTHKKCDMVIANREHVKNVRSEAGNAGSSARWSAKRDSKRMAKASQEHGFANSKTMPSTTTKEEREGKKPQEAFFPSRSESVGESAPASAPDAPSLDGGASSAPRSPPNGKPQMAPTSYLARDAFLIDRTPVRESTVPYQPWVGGAVAREPVAETDAANPPIGVDALAAALAALREQQEAAAAQRAREQAVAIAAERDRQLTALGAVPIQSDPDAATKARERLAEIAGKRAQSA